MEVNSGAFIAMSHAYKHGITYDEMFLAYRNTVFSKETEETPHNRLVIVGTTEMDAHEQQSVIDETSDIYIGLVCKIKPYGIQVIHASRPPIASIWRELKE